MYREALGLIEVNGYLGAIEAADTALKAANVSLIGCEIIKGGLVTVKIQGDVSSVKVAVAAAEIAVIKLKVLIVAHIISGPDVSVWDFIDKNTTTNKTEIFNGEEKTQEIKKIEFKSHTIDNTILKKELESKKAFELRTLVRSLKLDSLTKKEIKYASKNTLVEELILFYQRRDK
jgi:energy-coupling factor transport system substrate-specific component